MLLGVMNTKGGIRYVETSEVVLITPGAGYTPTIVKMRDGTEIETHADGHKLAQNVNAAASTVQQIIEEIQTLQRIVSEKP